MWSIKMKAIVSIALVFGFALCSLVTYSVSFPPFFETATAIDYVRYLFFAPGWFLLLAALVVRLRARRKDRIFFFLCIGLPLAFLLNLAVGVINAHAEEWAYWISQLAYCSGVFALAAYSIGQPAQHVKTAEPNEPRTE